MEWNGDLCNKCLPGYLNLKGRYLLNTCGAMISTDNCQYNHYCISDFTSHQECQLCKDQIEQCQCDIFSNCLRCEINSNSCQKCIIGYYFSDTNQQYEVKENICDFLNESMMCTYGNFCRGTFGSACQSCSAIKEGESCNCGGILQPQCIQCSATGCIKCISGYQVYQNNCISGASSNSCAFYTYCHPGSRDVVQCIDCTAVSQNYCSCGADFCQTCGKQQNTCGSCIKGYQLDSRNNCIQSSNICDQNTSSALCMNNYYCNGTSGTTCTTCDQIQPGQQFH
ncbi:Cysteine-rich protein [Spironucleus salmonicida]|uniref:Cysteine-rich protein n=1 Tax=Spironucleus salmonicida TaxID=348837 RepID=V6LVY3_9EUKA|nr:Cysteine-rich protein [Spironucleus salmonicida]|eukprot:EST47866.1 Cysteine-rich protein [Spironucleus salmonicida]